MGQDLNKHKAYKVLIYQNQCMVPVIFKASVVCSKCQ